MHAAACRFWAQINHCPHAQDILSAKKINKFDSNNNNSTTTDIHNLMPHSSPPGMWKRSITCGKVGSVVAKVF